MEKTRIELYKVREFGDVFNVTFAFIKQEFKPLGRAILVLILPFILIQGICSAVIQSSMMESLKNINIVTNGIGNLYITMLSRMWPIFIISVLVYTVMISTIASYFKLYNESENEITISELFNEIKSNFFQVLGALILLSIVTMLGLVLCILPGIYLSVSLSVFLMAVVMEQKGIGNAFSRSFQLVNPKWWWTFLIIFVSVIIIVIVTLIFQIPASIIGFTTSFHKIKNQTNPMEAFGTGYIIYTSIVSSIQQIIYIVPLILIAFQYFNLVEIQDKSSLNQKINAIGQNE
jgi:hypothetical protein